MGVGRTLVFYSVKLTSKRGGPFGCGWNPCGYSVILTSKRGGSFGCGWNPCCLQLDMNLNPWSGVKKKKPVLKIERENPAQHQVNFDITSRY